MKQIELKPCPFCGGKVELKDKTSNFYGFNGYEIKCNCGCVMKSDLCSEMIFEGNKCSTPVTERGKSKALSDLVALWNGSADRKQREGEWLGSWDYECSVCHEYHDIKTKHCPNCGAKMKGGAE